MHLFVEIDERVQCVFCFMRRAPYYASCCGAWFNPAASYQLTASITHVNPTNPIALAKTALDTGITVGMDTAETTYSAEKEKFAEQLETLAGIINCANQYG